MVHTCGEQSWLGDPYPINSKDSQWHTRKQTHQACENLTRLDMLNRRVLSAFAGSFTNSATLANDQHSKTC